MYLLKINLTCDAVTLQQFATADTTFRAGVHNIAPKAEVTLAYNSTQQVTGCIQCIGLPITQLVARVTALTAYLDQKFPAVVYNYTYEDSGS